jgi:hypothetical protein
MDCEITRAAECDLKRIGVLGMAEGQMEASNIMYQSNITQMGCETTYEMASGTMKAAEVDG